MPPAVVESQVCIKFNPNPNEIAGANRNLMLLTKKTINILRNPDTTKPICIKTYQR